MNYDAGNQMTSLNRYSDVLGANLVASSLYTYDDASRLTSINYQRANNTTINSFSYTYDAANRLTQETSNDGVSNYSYDATNQLTSTDNTNQADEAYSYDANGNRTTVGYGTGTNNQLLTDGKFNYQYDDEGNRTRKVEIATGEVTSYGWDYRNRLISVTVADVNGVVIKSVVYTYDVNNRRIGKVIDNDGVGAATATVERFVYDGNQIGLVFDGAGNQTHRYLYGAGVDQILADETVTGTNWAVTDKLGTVTDVIDNNGLVLNHIVYDSFGKVVSRSDTSFEFRYGFTGREYDGETGLDYYRARYYDSGNGRFISEDPIGFDAGDGNLTRYVGNSPTNFTDPSGLEAITVPSGGLGLGGLLEGAAGLFGAIRKYGPAIGTGGYILNLTDPITSQQAEEDAITEADKNKDPNKQPKPVPVPVPVPVPDPNCSEKEQKKKDEERRKKCKTRILYRGDRRSPAEDNIFNIGFTVNPENTMDNFENHVNSNPSNTIFISTSTKESVGIDFAVDRGNRDGYLYEICDPGGGENAEPIYRKKKYKGNHEFKNQAEVGFRYAIPTKNIIKATYYNQKRKSGATWSNPNYNP